jgi:amino acid adenylation domain-containing protein
MTARVRIRPKRPSLGFSKRAWRPHRTQSLRPAELTYAELDERANRLANYLTARCEGAEKFVGIALDRSLDMLVALIATWKAGYAYVPLDPKHPPARLRHILEESGVVVLVADGSADVDLISTGIPTIHMELEADAIVATSPRTLEPRCHARSLAYVIYTSGSTGRPKGVEIEQRSLVNLLEAMANRPGLTADDILLAVTTISFDIAALEMFLPLIVGGTVAIATTEEIADGALLLERLRLSRATAMQATPALWRVLLEAGFRSKPGFAMLCGGEPLRDDVAVRLLEGDGELWNMYGPTETTIWSSCSRVVRGQAIAVGTPIANTQFYVLDSNDRIVPQGAIGQLHIGGDGLARGYLKRPDLSADVFIGNPFGPGRIYRTGDSARLLANGELEILGRVDQQVKVRGFRVELGEIESVLAQVGGVAASAVLLREDVPGQPRLVGYYVDRAGCFTSHDELRSRLSTRLPEYMIPSLWVKLDTLPLTGNGKLDRAALPAPALQSRVDENYAAPQSPLEISLAKIWAEVLEIDRVGTHDDIFALGADSIHFFAITARANRQGIELLAKHLFKHRTIALVARQLESKAALSSNDASRLAPRANVTALR